jgi:succinate dehydrogenase/fumarate reductase cytochrome b subunit
MLDKKKSGSISEFKERRIKKKAGNGSLVLFSNNYHEIKDDKIKVYNRRFHEIAGKLLLFFAIIYVFLYSFIPSNPNYGNHASTCSNVGRDHRILFAIWGIVVCAALIVNLYYLLRKYNITSKFPKVMCNLGAVGVLGFICFENDKFQKFRVVLTKEQYTGKVSDPVQTFVASIPRLDFMFTKKTIHTTFAIIFGVCIAFAILYCLITLARRSKKYKAATMIFFGYMILSAMTLGIKLSGFTEAVIVDIAFIMLYMINYIDSLNDTAIISEEFKSETVECKEIKK